MMSVSTAVRASRRVFDGAALLRAGDIQGRARQRSFKMWASRASCPAHRAASDGEDTSFSSTTCASRVRAAGVRRTWRGAETPRLAQSCKESSSEEDTLAFCRVSVCRCLCSDTWCQSFNPPPFLFHMPLETYILAGPAPLQIKRNETKAQPRLLVRLLPNLLIAESSPQTYSG